MTVHQCPKCELRYERKTELDQHCREEHPGFRHDYPVGHPMHPDTLAEQAADKTSRSDA